MRKGRATYAALAASTGGQGIRAALASGKRDRPAGLALTMHIVAKRYSSIAGARDRAVANAITRAVVARSGRDLVPRRDGRRPLPVRRVSTREARQQAARAPSPAS